MFSGDFLTAGMMDNTPLTGKDGPKDGEEDVEDEGDEGILTSTGYTSPS